VNRPPVNRIGRYRLDTVVGTGAFATVYRAVDERLDATVAVKVLAENHSLDPDIRERFMAEGRVLRRIDSTYVVTVHDLGETDRQQPYLVLEYADRRTLADRVAELRNRRWRPDPRDIVAVAEPLARAVEAVHRAGVVHRDLSPGNVLMRSTTGSGRESASTVIGGDERLLLADLGMCKDLALHSGYTAAGGTAGFRPPEQLDGPAIVGPAADLWSLSALLVWLITGAPPGDAPIVDGVASAGLPAGLGTVLQHGLADDPAARHRDTSAWLSAVCRALEPPEPARLAPPTQPSPAGQRPATPAPPSPAGQGLAPTAEPSPVDRSCRRRRPVVRVAVAVVALAAATGAGFIVARASPSTGDLDIRHLEGGDVRVARTEGDTTIAIIGPEEIADGQSAVFAADTDEVDEWMWVSPEGHFHLDASRLEVRARSPGTARVTLIGATPSGEEISVTHTLRIVDR